MTLNIGIIGTGMIGYDHARRILQELNGAQITALNDVNKESAEKINHDFNIDATIYDNPHDLIKADNVDAVFICSWGPTHEEFAIAAINANKFVFCEKPLTPTAQGCKNIVDAEMGKDKRLLQVGFMRRYDKAYNLLKKTLDEKSIGEPLVVHCAHRNAIAPSFFSTDMLIEDALVHELDVLRWLLGENYISTQVILPKSTKLAHKGLIDPQIILLETESGVRIDVEIFVNCQYGYDIQCEVVAEKAVANLPQPQSVIKQENFKNSSHVSIDWRERFIEAYDIEIQAFIDNANNGFVSGPSSWDGYMAAISTDACLKSKDSGVSEKINMPKTPEFYVA